jgi:hypothetical protein
MASRQYSIPYNPQDWGPVRGNHGQATYSQQATVHHAAPQQRLHAGWWFSRNAEKHLPKLTR